MILDLFIWLFNSGLVVALLTAIIYIALAKVKK